jgi:hypothetical protein
LGGGHRRRVAVAEGRRKRGVSSVRTESRFTTYAAPRVRFRLWLRSGFNRDMTNSRKEPARSTCP